MRTSNRALLLASASLGALGLGSAGAQAQLVQYNYTTSPGSITAPTAAAGSSIGQLAAQINATINAAAVVTGGASVVNNPGTGAVSATNTVSANAITGTVAGNMQAPATGALFTVNLANMAAAGGGTAAGTVFQSNASPTLLGGVGVTAAGVRDATGATIATTFAGSLNNTATMANNVIGSTANGNQANNVVGGVTPAAGIAAGTAGSGIVVGPETVRQRTNTVTFTGSTTGAAIPAGAVGAAVGLIPAAGGTFFWGNNVDATPGIQANSTDTVLTGAAGAAVAPVVGAYTDTSFAGGRTVDVTGVIAASTGQVNGALTGNAIRATTDLGTVTANLGGGMSSGSLAQTGNAVQAAASGNAATTGLSVTGGAPTVGGGLAVFSGQTNNTAAAGASIAALNNLGSVTTAIGTNAAANALTSSTLSIAGNTLSAAGAGNQASNSLTIANTVLAGAGGANGAGNLSTGVVRAEERTQAVTAAPLTPGVLTTSAFTAVAADSSGVGAFNSASIGADYAAMNLQRNRGTDTGALTVSGTLTGASVTALGATGATATTAANSTLGLTGNQLLGSAIGNQATTNVGGTQMRVADTATVAAVNLQESLNTVARSIVGGTGADASRIGLVLTNNAVTAGAGQAAATGSALTNADNVVRSTAQLNNATTTLSGVAANGTTPAASAQMTVNARATNATAPQNLDVAFGGVTVGAFDPDLGTTTTTAAPLRFSAVSAQRVGDTGAAAMSDSTWALTRGTTIDVGLLGTSAAGAGAATSFTAATGTTASLARNVVASESGGNTATVGVSFAEGMGSVIPGGALAGNAQIVSPNSSRNIGAQTDATLIAFTGLGTVGTGGSATTIASQFSGGSVALDSNAITARSIANQGQASISALPTLIAGGAGGTGASVSLTPGSPDATAAGAQLGQASASYLVANTQRLVPTGADNTVGVSGTVSGTQVSAVTGATSTTVGVTNNTALSVAAGNVFAGGLTDLRGTGAATFAAVSDQAASGTRVASSVENTANSFMFLATAGRAGNVQGGVTTPGAITASTVSVDGNLSRALGVMNEASLTVAGATVADLAAAGSGRQSTVSFAGAGNPLGVSNAEIALASTQSAAFSTAGVDTPVQRTVVATNTNTGVGILGVSPSTVTGSTLSVAGNTVDSRAVGNAASQTLSGDYFAGGVALANSQQVTQTGADAGMSATTSGTRVQIAIAPPVAGAGASGVVANLANNTVGASTLVNDATQSLAAVRPGSVSTTTGRTATSTQVAAGASATPLNITGADFALANAQSTNGVRASATTSTTNITANLPSAASMASVTGNRVFAEVVGNRLASTTVLPSMASGVMQLASSQVNTGSSFTSTVSGTTVGLQTAPGSSAASQAMVTNNVIGASAMGNVIRASVGGR